MEILQVTQAIPQGFDGARVYLLDFYPRNEKCLVGYCSGAVFETNRSTLFLVHSFIVLSGTPTSYDSDEGPVTDRWSLHVFENGSQDDPSDHSYPLVPEAIGWNPVRLTSAKEALSLQLVLATPTFMFKLVPSEEGILVADVCVELNGADSTKQFLLRTSAKGKIGIYTSLAASDENRRRDGMPGQNTSEVLGTGGSGSGDAIS